MANIYDMADTWNDVGTTFTAIKMDVTDTASASGSLLMDLQVNGAPVFSVTKNGLSVKTISPYVTYGYLAEIQHAFSLSGYDQASTGRLAFSNSNTSVSTLDLFITRKGPANIRLGAADAGTVVPQILSVQGGSGTNIAGANFTIQGSQSTGDQPGGSILFQVSPAGSAGSGQNGFETALTINSKKSIIVNNYNSNPYAAFAFPISGTYSVGLYQPSDYTLQIAMSNADVGGPVSSAYKGFSFAIDTATLSWGLTQYDIVLARDAANTLALRNGANAQEFRVYKTTTGTVYKALLGDNNLIKISGEAFTDGAGANTATLANAPAAGDPTKWIPIDDNGTTRYIPAW